MVKRVLLPESAGALHPTIDLRCRIHFPGCALLQHGRDVWERDQNVNVIRHHDEVRHGVSVTIEVE
jgi:hypothetical protein